MPNIIDGNGLQVNSLNEILTSLTNAFNNIYGANINLDQNTPDAQMINVFAQILVSYSELLQDINASFDPDQAVGVILDQRVKLNGITRKQGVKTITNILVTFDGSATLKGLDLYSTDECFKVSDNPGNSLVPIATTTGVNGNVLTVPFIAVNYGALNFTEGSITNIDTPTIGVASVSNLATELSDVGSDEESDTSLRVRRTVSAEQIGGLGATESLRQSIYNTSQDISYVGVEENDGDTEDIFGIPPHGIWIVVNGAFNSEDVAQAIYKNRIAGTPMRHLEESSSSSGEEITEYAYPVTREDGTQFMAYWSRAKEKNIYCKITCFILNEVMSEQNVKNVISGTTLPETKETLSTTTIINNLTEAIPNIVISSIELSQDGVGWASFATPNPDEYFRIPVENITVTEYNQ